MAYTYETKNTSSYSVEAGMPIGLLLILTHATSFTSSAYTYNTKNTSSYSFLNKN